ncbi:MAG: tetratricopeptide repeat protein [Pseudomonadota bacterium]
MKHWPALLFTLALVACASAPPIPKTTVFFNDHLFSQAAEPINVNDVFAVNQEMEDYLHSDIAQQLKLKGYQQGLFDALYNKHELKLEYDSVTTKNAAQTFKTKTGNCLSLAIMTAAFAKKIGISVEFQSVVVDDTWSRSGDLYINAGHVNIVLGRRYLDFRTSYMGEKSLTIDFLAPGEIGSQHTHHLNEETILAMYMNNRAAELLVQGKLDDAYWAAREAIKQDASFIAPYNTLGVIYKKHGNFSEAQQVLSFALLHSPENTVVMSNLAQTFKDLGKLDEANLLVAKLQKIQPYPPFHFFHLGQAAMQREDYAGAKILFAKEVARDPNYHEFHFWLALAHFRLGELKQANEQLTIAQENSTTQRDHDLYAAKLNRLRSHQTQQ